MARNTGRNEEIRKFLESDPSVTYTIDEVALVFADKYTRGEVQRSLEYNARAGFITRFNRGTYYAPTQDVQDKEQDEAAPTEAPGLIEVTPEVKVNLDPDLVAYVTAVGGTPPVIKQPDPDRALIEKVKAYFELNPFAEVRGQQLMVFVGGGITWDQVIKAADVVCKWDPDHYRKVGTSMLGDTLYQYRPSGEWRDIDMPELNLDSGSLGETLAAIRDYPEDTIRKILGMAKTLDQAGPPQTYAVEPGADNLPTRVRYIGTSKRTGQRIFMVDGQPYALQPL